MKIELDTTSGDNVIGSYRPGSIFVNDSELTDSFIVMPDALIRNWPPKSMKSLQLHHVAMIAELDPELVIFGSGERIVFPAISLLAPLLERNIGYEIMGTASACRSFSILGSEGRRVAAAMMMIANEAGS